MSLTALIEGSASWRDERRGRKEGAGREAATNAAARELRGRFHGPLHRPGTTAYDAQRATFGGRLDARPALVAEALGAADVAAALRAAREHRLPFAVQSTGHGTHVPADGALLLKTGRMAQVLVDPDRRVARVGAGAVWSDVIAAAAPFGLAPVTGDTPSVGVAGFTLGGGVGWLSRAFGFGADNVLRAEVVTADGRVRRVGPGRDEELFWALRGGGASFGVVTELEIRLHAVPQVHAGTLLFAIEHAEETLARFREWAPRQPWELTTSVALLRRSPDPRVQGPVMAVKAMHAGGSPADAERALRGLLDGAGAPLAGSMRTSACGEARIGGTAPRAFELLEDLPEQAIAAAVAAVTVEDGAETAANAVELRCWGGAMADPWPGSGPVGHRHVPFSVTVDGPPAAAAPLAACATGGSFLNFLADQTRTHAAWTPRDHARLREVKRAYDPANVLGMTHNVAPAGR